MTGGIRARTIAALVCLILCAFVHTADAQCVCGAHNTVNSRIVGGEETFPNEYPAQVVLRYKDDMFHFCGGSLINNQWVVTAAHCLYGQNHTKLLISIGDHNKLDHDESREIHSTVAEIIVHPHYGSIYINNDIGLIKLSEPVTFSSTISPICIPPVQLPLTGETVTAIGWGRTYGGGPTSTYLLKVELEAMTIWECVEETNWKYQKRRVRMKFFSSEKFCAGGDGVGSTCNGDSGGAIIANNPASPLYLIGIVSAGPDGCLHKGYPGIYTNVFQFAKWIEQETGQLCEP